MTLHVIPPLYKRFAINVGPTVMKASSIVKAPVLKRIRQTLKREYGYYRKVWQHPETPRFSRWMLGGALAYLAMPFDLIPDWIPVLGQVDDLIIVPLFIWIGLRAIPEAVKMDCRHSLETTEANQRKDAHRKN